MRAHALSSGQIRQRSVATIAARRRRVRGRNGRQPHRWKHDDDLVDLHHTDKLRGPGFEPITFKIEKFTTPKLVDAKGRAIPTLRVVSISEAEQAEQARNIRRDEDKLLVELLKNADRSWADLARACGFVLDNGEPYKSKVRRIADELQSNKLLKKTRGQRWTLTDQGRKAAEKLNDKARADVADKMADKIAELAAQPTPTRNSCSARGAKWTTQSGAFFARSAAVFIRSLTVVCRRAPEAIPCTNAALRTGTPELRNRPTMAPPSRTFLTPNPSGFRG